MRSNIRWLIGLAGMLFPIALAKLTRAYAGAVIAETKSEVKLLVYVTALAPDEGEKITDMFYRMVPHPKAPKLSPDSHGLIYLPHAAFAAAFAQNATTEEQEQLAAVQRPIALPCITVPVGRPLWKDRPSRFLLAEQDRMIVKETQRLMAERMKAKVRTHPVDHTPSVTAPSVVVDIILEALQDVSKDAK
jgi:pimeloyl-ACP methyl ester carboxylesterase